MAGSSDQLQKAEKQSKPGGKKLADIDAAKNDATGRASDVARQSAFAGIATIWLLSKEDVGAIQGIFIWALLALALALFVDFMQYVYCSWTWKKFYNEQYEKHNSDDALVDIPESLTANVYRFFWAKIIILCGGYVFLLTGAASQLNVF